MAGNVATEPGDAGAQGAAKKAPRLGMRLLAAVLAGIVACAFCLCAYVEATLPRSDARYDDTKLYDYTYMAGRSANDDFICANMSDDGHLWFGTSELWFTTSDCFTVPAGIFGGNDFGLDATFVGEAYCQSLWQAIAFGAYAKHDLPSNKVMFIVSPQWFAKNNGSAFAFSTEYDYALYSEFCSNPNVSDEAKQYVRERVEQSGVDETKVRAANRDTVVDAANDAAFTLQDRLDQRQWVNDIRAKAIDKTEDKLAGTSDPDITAADGAPDWQKILDEAYEQAAPEYGNNDYGIRSSWWDSHKDSENQQLNEDFHEADQEYADFAWALRICKEAGFEPLVCILPCNGLWYDMSNVPASERSVFYDNIRSACDDVGVAYADFSSCEYEPYFFNDNMHPGYVGWARIDQAFYDFVNDKDDAFLGGADFGWAEGLGSEDALKPAGESL